MKMYGGKFLLWPTYIFVSHSLFRSTNIYTSICNHYYSFVYKFPNSCMDLGNKDLNKINENINFLHLYITTFGNSHICSK